jgi:cytolysin (calcineurin-like family phosphatase)
MFKKKADGTYAYSSRFWTYVVIATFFIVWIGVRTQQTADQVENQAAATAEFANETNACLVQVVNVLTTRVGYNDDIAKLDERRQAVWEQLVTDLSLGEGNADLNKAALQRFFTVNAEIKKDQAKVAAAREKNQYPECSQFPK